MRDFVYLALITLVFLFFGQRLYAQSEAVAVNIFFDPETTVPLFYEGRPEATVGSNVRAVAILSGIANPEDYYYRWLAGTEVVAGGVVKGQNTVNIPLLFSDEMIISVEVYDTDFNTIATGREFLELSEPFVKFYEDNPLRGVVGRALGNRYFMAGKEITLRAEPYFMNKDIFSQQPRLEWSLDGRAIGNQNQDKLNLTLQTPTDATGQTQVGFYLHNTKNLLQFVRQQVMISF